MLSVISEAAPFVGEQGTHISIIEATGDVICVVDIKSTIRAMSVLVQPSLVNLCGQRGIGCRGGNLIHA